MLAVTPLRFLHYVAIDKADKVHQWQSSRPLPAISLTIAEAFNHIELRLQHRLEDWSDVSKDIIYERRSLFEQCYTTCLKERKCPQLEYLGETC